MISAVAMLTVSMAMKNTQMLSPNSTPARPARRKSPRLGQRLVTATITSSTADAIHIRQNDSTTPEAWVDLPNTPPIDQNKVATTTAMTPPDRPAFAVADCVDSLVAFRADASREAAGVVTCAR